MRAGGSLSLPIIHILAQLKVFIIQIMMNIINNGEYVGSKIR